MSKLFSSKKANKEYIIAKLCSHLERLNFSMGMCAVCNDIDHIGEFKECHLGSDIWCCEECLANADFEELKICENCPYPSEDRDDFYENKCQQYMKEAPNSKKKEDLSGNEENKEDIVTVGTNRDFLTKQWNIDELGMKDPSANKSFVPFMEKGGDSLFSSVREKEKNKPEEHLNKKKSFEAKEVDLAIIIEHLEDLFFQLKAPITTCDLCGWEDIGEPFPECCPGSNIRCCKICTENAKKENTTLCRNYCPYFNNSNDDIDESFSLNNSKDIQNNVEIEEDLKTDIGKTSPSLTKDIVEKNNRETLSLFNKERQEDSTLIICKGDNLPSPSELDISEEITKADNEEILLTPVKRIKVVRLNSSISNTSPKEEIYF